MKTTKSIFGLLLGLLFLIACNSNKNTDEPVKEKIIEKFSKEKPYAIQISKERSYYQAEKLTKRLLDMGLDAYIVQNNDSVEDIGEWYYILCGNIANKDSAKIISKRIRGKIKLKSEKLKISTYSNFKNAEIDIDSLKSLETKRIGTNKPGIKKDIFQVLNKFPESNLLYVQSASVINTPKNIDNKKGFGHVYSMKMDLPRGIKKKLLLEKTTAFTEVIYKDNLYGDRVTIEIGKLRKSGPILNKAAFLNISNNENFKIAEEYADLILETGDYLFEEKKQIEVDSYTKLYGYKVTIETKKDHFRTYLILVDASNQYIIFSQSTDKTEEDLFVILSEIGKGEGLLNYDEFYNVFYTIPEQLIENDIFVGFTINKLDFSYAKAKGNAKWAKAYVGHWAATGYFYNEKKGLWSYGLFDVLTSDKRGNIDKLYATETETETIDVYGVKGHIVYRRKFNSKTWQFYKALWEINFGIGRYACMVDNSSKSWLNKAELLERAEALQFKKQITNTDENKPLL